MAIRQLYYTSCRDGLLGHAGFQFNAATPGVEPEVLLAAEDLTSYRPPGSMPADPAASELPAYPVVLTHQPGNAGPAGRQASGTAGGTSITAQVVYAGTDYSRRPGNYFAHALVADSAADFGDVLPIELWKARWWRREPVTEPELPLLHLPPEPGEISREVVARFLADRDPGAWLALLSAAGITMTRDRPVLLAGDDCDVAAIWIASVCYALGPVLGRRLSFTTYSHRPDSGQHHLTGIWPEQLKALSSRAFQVFDTATGQSPDVPVHPLAKLLARAGVVQAGPLWQEAARLGADEAGGFDDWYPAVAAAAVLLEVALEPGDQDAAVSWLGGTDVVSAAEQVAGKLMSRPGREMSGNRIAGVRAAARRLRSGSMLERAELVLVEQAYVRFGQAEPPPDPVRLTSLAALDRAGAACADLLGRPVPPALAVSLLRWTEAAGAEVAPGQLRGYGEQVLVEEADSGVIADLLDGRPEVRLGLISRLAASPDAAERVLASGKVLSYDELGGYPALMERWLLAARGRGELSPLEVFREISELRPAGGGFSAELLSQLWPDGCQVPDLRVLLRLSAEVGGEFPGQWLDWVLAAVGEVLTNGAAADCARLAVTLHDYPDLLRRLPRRLAGYAAGWAALNLARTRAVAMRVEHGDLAVLGSIYQAYREADRDTQRQLKDVTRELLLLAERLDLALADCPPAIRRAFCVLAGDRLRNPLRTVGLRGVHRFAPLRAERVLAVRLFVAMASLRRSGASEAEADLVKALDPVASWPRSWRRDLRGDLGVNAEAFTIWLKQRRNGA